MPQYAETKQVGPVGHIVVTHEYRPLGPGAGGVSVLKSVTVHVGDEQVAVLPCTAVRSYWDVSERVIKTEFTVVNAVTKTAEVAPL